MKRFYKRLIYIASGVAILATSILVIRAANNRGNAPFIYLKFDEGYGTTTYDESGNSNDATITGPVWKDEQDCRVGKCLYYDGTSDYVSIPDFVLE